MLWRFSGPLKSLENLYQLAKAMFAGDQRAEEAFRNTMLRLIRHAPEGGVKLLRQRTGLPTSAIVALDSAPPRGRWCSIPRGVKRAPGIGLLGNLP